MISKKAKYALKALHVLATHGKNSDEPVLISDLADREKIPRKFLEAILLDLKKRGILKSKMGRWGGYYLAKKASAISLGDVLRILEGPLAPLPCLSKTAYAKCTECDDERHCGIRLVFKDVYDSTLRILENTSLEDMVEKTGGIRDQIMYQI